MIIEGNNKQSRKILFLIALFVLIAVVIGYWLNHDDALTDTQSNIQVSTFSKNAQDKLSINKESSAVPKVKNTELKEQNTQPHANNEIAKDKVTIDELNNIEEEGSNEGGNNEPQYSEESISREVEQLSFLLNTDNQDDLAIDKIKQNILNRSKQDPSTLNDLISLYEANLDNQLIKNELIDVLGAIKDPEVEQLGMKLARSSDQATIIEGLDLLGQLSIPSNETLELTVQLLLQNQTDPNIILPAIHAMPTITISGNKRAEILQVLSGLSQHESEGVRSEALFAISKWAKTDQQLNPLIQALDSESTDNRISAIMAIQKSTVVSVSLKEILLARMTDNNELWEIRSIAAEALERFDLSDAEYADYKEFKEKQATDIQ